MIMFMFYLIILSGSLQHLDSVRESVINSEDRIHSGPADHHRVSNPGAAGRDTRQCDAGPGEISDDSSDVLINEVSDDSGVAECEQRCEECWGQQTRVGES